MFCYSITLFCYNVLFLEKKVYLSTKIYIFFPYMIAIQRKPVHKHKEKMLGRTLVPAKFIVKVSIFIKQPLEKL